MSEAELQDCDLVLNGGVTSGVVYPAAILGLKEKYRFRCVGGTSAGAVAATVVAAAEYGRQTGRGGFDPLEQIRNEMGEPERLLGLFQPTPDTRPLLTLGLSLLDAIRRGAGRDAVDWMWTLRSVLHKAAPAASRQGVLVGLGLAALTAVLFGGLIGLLVPGRTWQAFVWPAVIAMAALAPLALLTAGVVFSVRVIWHTLTLDVPRNVMGICTGFNAEESQGVPALTPWLHHHIQAAAGRTDDKPLLFEDLRAHDVTLRMVTTNLSQERPSELPFDRAWAYKDDEFRRLFPPDVLESLRANAHKSESVVLPAGYSFLPDADKLPVLVATRLSLSFPLLLSAVPLYGISRHAFAGTPQRPVELTEPDLQRNWFSDGGITSNFPIHIFDRWLPRRPTFGISLHAMPSRAIGATHVSDIFIDAQRSPTEDTDPLRHLEGDDARADERTVWLPRPNEPVGAEWKPLELENASVPSLTRFLFAIVSTALGYRDAMQSEMAGYRERIVRIRLSEDEGGLNLATSTEALNSMRRKGESAAEEILEKFEFDQHAWVRHRTVCALLEQEFAQLAEEDRETKRFLGLRRVFERMIDARSSSRPFPYSRDAAWCRTALEAVEQLEHLAHAWDRDHFRRRPPKVESVLRVTPRI